MNSILVIAPHPDDETLGCGGTLLKHKAEGSAIHWLIVTCMTQKAFPQEKIDLREKEIEKVFKLFGFESLHQLKHPTGMLDTLPLGLLIEEIGKIVERTEPNIVYLPYQADIHSDHRITFQAGFSCTKWFRAPSIRRVLAYETVSETDFAPPAEGCFLPNSFVDINPYLEKKINIMKVYESELGGHPFPRSIEGIRALATLRGAAAGVNAAEAFVLLKELAS